jgi:hypothetical protein
MRKFQKCDRSAESSEEQTCCIQKLNKLIKASAEERNWSKPVGLMSNQQQRRNEKRTKTPNFLNT